jgi:hypothetical protein
MSTWNVAYAEKHTWLRTWAALLPIGITLTTGTSMAASLSPTELAAKFEQRVTLRRQVPAEEQQAYAQKMQQALLEAKLTDLAPQYVLVVDRNPLVQTMFIYWNGPKGKWQFIGAAPVSTGKPGSFDHFYSPIGVFLHTLENPDYRAQGTKNDRGIRGYGVKGMRVYDMGWATGEKGWGKGGPSIMRLQMHATDPVLEARLGRPASKGCIRIPGELNRLIDHYGLIDAEYEEASKGGRSFWVLSKDREVVDTPGKYMVITDSEQKQRPAWIPEAPAKKVTPLIKETPTTEAVNTKTPAAQPVKKEAPAAVPAKSGI